MNESCKKLVRHLNRIQGQMDALKDYIADDRECEDVAHLLKSITTSFASVRTSIVEEMLMREVAAGSLKRNNRELIRSIVSVLNK